MKAGRELDRLVAEKVMGKNSKYHYKISTGKGHYHPYSTSISAAWEVVEKLLETIPSLSVQCDNWVKDGKSYYVTWVDTEHGLKTEHAASDESPAHAICLAALRLFD